VWLYAGITEKFSHLANQLINDHELTISPIVRLELQYLYEIQRVTAEPHIIITDLNNQIGLQVCGKLFDHIVIRALTCTWTRDPFDRLIVAHASLNNDLLLTKDQAILDNYGNARW
jgi:PIN domain nuclease of toxin-antitoxin system